MRAWRRAANSCATIVPDVDTENCGFKIATGDESAKGRQLLANRHCALAFYWSPLARAVRVRGVAQRASAAESADDFLARHSQARAIALASRQSSIFSADATRDELIAQAKAAIEVDAGIFSPHWAVWTVVPNSVEFWQGDPSRNHQRLSYMRTGTTWDKHRLWSCGTAAIYYPSRQRSPVEHAVTDFPRARPQGLASRRPTL